MNFEETLLIFSRRAELSAAKAQFSQSAAAASAAALSSRNQRILHKQQLDNLRST